MSDETKTPSTELSLRHPKRKSVKREKLRTEVLEMLGGRGQTFSGFVRRFGYRRALPGVVKELISEGLVTYEPTYRTTGGWVGFFRITESGKHGMTLSVRTGKAELANEEQSQGCPPEERSGVHGQQEMTAHGDSLPDRSDHLPDTPPAEPEELGG